MTWDVKGSVVLGILGGIRDIVSRGLKSVNKLEEFVSTLDRVYGSKVKLPLKGEN